MSVLPLELPNGEITTGQMNCLSGAVNAIGKLDFADHVLGFLNQVCGAKHCGIFHLADEGLRGVGVGSDYGANTGAERIALYLHHKVWRQDSSLAEVWDHGRPGQAQLSNLKIANLKDGNLRRTFDRIADRIVVGGIYEEWPVALSILRSECDGTFGSADWDRLTRWSSVLLSLTAKHVRSTKKRSSFVNPLASLLVIERVMLGAAIPIPMREMQVGARILYGLCTGGIASDLRISADTVISYRRRLYQRLQIATSRELLMWFLDRYGMTDSLTAPH